MGGNRKHGFRRGNANGRNGSGVSPKWFCQGCGKMHGGQVSRTRMLDGFDYCDRQYFKRKEAEFAERKKEPSCNPAT